MEKKEHVLWDYWFDCDDDFIKNVIESDAECNEYDANELTDNQKMEIVYEYLNMYLEDQRINLNIEVPNGIIEIGSLGLWHGRVSGYGNEELSYISDCFNMSNGCTYSVDEDDDLVLRQSHHDGVNYFTFREWKEWVEDDDKDEFKNLIYENKADKEIIDKYTLPLGLRIKEVYGWE